MRNVIFLVLSSYSGHETKQLLLNKYVPVLQDKQFVDKGPEQVAHLVLQISQEEQIGTVQGVIGFMKDLKLLN